MPVPTERSVPETAIDLAAVLAHLQGLLRQVRVEQFVAARDLARSEDGLVLERLPSGEFAWLRP